MKCRNFLQFELLRPARLVKKEGEPKASPVTEAEKPKAPKAKTAIPPAEGTAAVAEARAAGDRDQATEGQKAERFVAQQTEQTGDAEKAKKEEAEKIIEDLAKKYPEAFGKYEKETAENPEQAEKALIEAIKDPTDKQKLAAALSVADPTKPEEKEESSDKTSDALKGAGFGALLEKLIDRLTKLFDKLSVELTKLFGSFEKKAAKAEIKSPLGENKKFTIAKDYKAGEGITIAADANAEIYSVGNGTVTNIDKNANTIEITGPDEKSKIVYKNVIPDSNLKTGADATKIEPGKQLLLGKAASNAGIPFQYFDANGTERDRTENFKRAELIEEKDSTPLAGPTALADKQSPDAKPAAASTPPKT
ncbi:hypothetical protein HZC21_03345 [Candidatus Peregrinibacteria bacterium]|nr:hypothetical protein [Candidatus Peregrinibacteria bacterium]